MLLLCATLLIVYALLLWAASVKLHDASIIDRFWGAGFILIVAAGLWRVGTPSAHQLLLAGLVTVWGTRLSIHLTWRNWGTGEDYRYRAMREKHGASFVWKSLFSVFLLQSFLTWFISLPIQVVFASEPEISLGPIALLGSVLFALGLLFESVGDWQLARFKANPDNAGQVMDTGLWRYTRHPNYFGDAVLWWGLYITALPAPGAAYTFLSPIVMTLFLMKVSGVPLLEKRMSETRPDYAAYARRTPTFFPWWPKS